jgi:hypothetical protein
VNHRDADLRLLAELLDGHADELTATEVEAFAGMRCDLTMYPADIRERAHFDELTPKQRAWVTGVHERIVGKPLTRLTAGEIPRGREVPTPPVLQHLPKRPPPMPKSTGAPQRASRKHCGRTDEGCYAFVNGDCSCACCGG